MRLEKVSVIIPTFNRAKYVGEAIESALGQTSPVYEILIVDDGSADNTREIVTAYGAPVKYIYQENRGPAAARNTGLRHASGQYIAFLDSDDLWEPDKTAVQKDFLATYPQVDFVFGQMIVCKDTGLETEPEILDREAYEYFRDHYSNSDKACEYLLRANIIPTSSVMFRSACLSTIGYFREDLRCAEDYDYWLRFAFHFTIGFLDHVVEKRRFQGDNIIGDYLLQYNSTLRVLEDFRMNYPSLPDSVKRQLGKAIRRTCYRLGSEHFQRHDFENSFKFLKEIFPYRAWDLKYNVKFLLAFLCSRLLKAN